MSKILIAFFISLAMMALSITLSVVFIENMSVLLSVLLLEILIYLVFLIVIQGMFLSHRQAYTTRNMLKHVKKFAFNPTSLTHYLKSLNEDFHIQRLSELATLYSKVHAQSMFQFKKKTYVSILHLKQPIKLDDILALHEKNISNRDHKIRVLMTILETNDNVENFLHTIMYDHTTKPTQYHIPVYISPTHIHLFDETKYLAHPDIKSIMTYIHKTIKKT